MDAIAFLECPGSVVRATRDSCTIEHIGLPCEPRTMRDRRRLYDSPRLWLSGPRALVARAVPLGAR